MKIFKRLAVWLRKKSHSGLVSAEQPLNAENESWFAQYCGQVFNLEVGPAQEGQMPGPFFMFNEGVRFKDAVLFIDVRQFWEATHVAVIKGPKPSPHAFGVVFYSND